MNHAAAARFLLAVCFLVLLFSGGARFAIGLLLHPMAHDLSNSDRVEAAYRRSDLFEKRRKLMDDWAGYLTTTDA